MFTVVIAEKEGAERRVTFAESEVTVGRVPGNDVVLPKGNVSKRHSRIVLKDNRFIVVDLKSTNGTYVNGRKITSPLVVKEGDKIYVGDYVLTLEGAPALDALKPPSLLSAQAHGDVPAHSLGALRAQRDMMRETQIEPGRDAHREISHGVNGSNGSGAEDDIPAVLRGAGSIPPTAIAAHSAEHSDDAPDEEPVDDAMLAAESELEVFEDRSSREQEREPSDELPSVQVFPPPLEGRTPVRQPASAQRAPDVRVGQGGAREPARESLGPLEGVLADPAVCHVVVERFDRVRADRGAGLKLEPVSFATPEALVRLAYAVRAQANLPSDVTSYDVSLASGLQVVAVLPAAASNGAVMSFRRRPTGVVLLAGLEDQQLLPHAVHTRIQAAAGKGHIWVVGPVGADLAGFLGSILASCPLDERVALFERAPEIALAERAAICLKHGVVALPELLERVQAFRPDRLVFHGLRESELKGLLDTLGHRADGYLASFAARSAQDALAAFDRSVGVDQTLRAVSLLVELTLDESGATRASGAYEIELDASGGLALRG